MSISSISGGSYAAQLNATRLAALKGQLDGLTTKLATGRTAETYGGLGTGRSTALSAQAQISALDGYAAAIGTASTRLSLASASLTQVTTLASTASRALASGTYGLTRTGLSSQQTSARGQLVAALDALNQTTGDTYVFSGRATGTAPVPNADLLIDGDPNAHLDGLKAVIAERKSADGTGGTGLLSVSSGPGATVTLSEPASGLTRANLGFTIKGVSSSNTSGISVSSTAASAPAVAVALAQQPKDGDVVRVTVNQADGSQKLVDYVARTSPTPGSTTEFSIGTDVASATANLQALIGAAPVAAAQSGSPSPGAGLVVTSEGTAGADTLGVGTPADGDTVTLTLGLHDGTTTTLTLTARTTPNPSDPTQFAIGTSAADTASNLQAALTTSLGTAAGTTLAASSATVAAKDFFAGSTSPGLSPRRIGTVTYTDGTGTPHTTQGFLTASDGRSVVWYQGDDAPGSARATASAQIGAGQSIAFGTRADEPAIQSALAGLGVLASETFAVGDDAGGRVETARYQAVSTRVNGLFNPPDGQQTLVQIGTELGLADTAMKNAQDQNAATKTVLQNTVADIETASPETVSTEILALQTQLQASYQVTSMLSKLSLVNYL